MLEGRRTYILAALIAVCSGIHALGYLDETAYMTILGMLNAGGLAALRSGVKKSGPV